MKARILPRHPARLLIGATATCASLLALIGPAAASANPGVTTIYIRGNSPSNLRFVGPKRVREGSQLEIVNETDPKKVGPQTFSLVEEEEVPTTRKERAACLSKGHICKAIMGWNRVTNGKASKRWANAGQPGWGELGSVTGRGDSWFTNKKGQSFSESVNAGATAAPVVLTFISAFDPALSGSITVVP